MGPILPIQRALTSVNEFHLGAQPPHTRKVRGLARRLGQIGPVGSVVPANGTDVPNTDAVSTDVVTSTMSERAALAGDTMGRFVEVAPVRESLLHSTVQPMSDWGSRTSTDDSAPQEGTFGGGKPALDFLR